MSTLQLIKGGPAVSTNVETEAPHTSPRRDGVAVLARCAYELELCTGLLEAGDPFHLPNAAPYIARAADAVTRLQALVAANGEEAPALKLAP